MHKNNKMYLKNIKENWIILLPQGFLLMIQVMILGIGFNVFIEVLDNIQDSYARTFAVLIVLFALIKLISWLGLPTLNDYGNTWVKVMAGKNA